MRRRTFLQRAAASAATAIWVSGVSAREPERKPRRLLDDHPWEKTIYSPQNGAIALMEDFQESVGCGYGKHLHGLLLCKSYDVTRKVFVRLACHSMTHGSDVRTDVFEHKITWPAGGESLMVRTLKDADDYWKFHGHAYPWIGFESITDWPTDECYLRMRAPLRWPHSDDLPWKPPEGLPRMRRTYYS